MTRTQHLLSVVVPCWNALPHLEQCLQAVLRTRPAATELIVVDDGSSTDPGPLLARLAPNVTSIRLGANLGFTAATRAGVEVARGEFLALLNSDVVVSPGALAELCLFLQRSPGHGAAAPLVLGLDGRPRRSCRRLPEVLDTLLEESALGRLPLARRRRDRYLLEELDPLVEQDVEQPAAACLVVRRAAWDEVGGLDACMALYFSDVDLCLRLRAAGRPIRYLPTATVVHEGGVSAAGHPETFRRWQRDRIAYFRKHRGWSGHTAACAATAWRVLEECLRAGRLEPRERRNARRRLLSDLVALAGH